jgi:lysophospholipase L1-like esterase
MSYRYVLQALGLFAGAVAFGLLLLSGTGTVFWAALACLLISLIWAFDGLRKIAEPFWGVKSRSLPLNEITLTTVCVALTLVVTESALDWNEKASIASDSVGVRKKTSVDVTINEGQIPHLDSSLSAFPSTVSSEVIFEAARRQSMVTMPQEWERQSVTANGATRATVWHGVLHVYDVEGIRRTSEFPPKREKTFRVVVVGDSLTYGDGIDNQYTFTAVLQRLMERDYSIEFLNLGSEGFQSEDIKQRIYKFVPRLHPDLVIYGVCHNDFLPSGVGQYSTNDAFSIPLPKFVKEDLAKRSRIIRLSTDGYNQLLLRLGLRADFYDDILKDFRNYQERFMNDVQAMNSYVRSQGLPPVVAMVLDQFPALDSRGYQITRLAERLFGEAGMTVIDTAAYYRRYSGQNFSVSRWEGHPNEVVNGIWALMIQEHLRGRIELEPFAKQ